METMASQGMVPASFFYYSPDPNPENRQHGHFTAHPALNSTSSIICLSCPSSQPCRQPPSTPGQTPQAPSHQCTPRHMQ